MRRMPGRSRRCSVKKGSVVAIERGSLAVVLGVVICSCLWPQPSPAQAPARLVKDINAQPDPYRDSSPASLVAVGDTLYFVADDGVNGRQLWRSAGTVSLTHIDKGTIENVTAVGEGVFFTVYDYSGNDHSVALWHSDGTLAGTAVFKEFAAGYPYRLPSSLTDVDGTDQGTFLVKEFDTGDLASVTGLTNLQGLLVFVAFEQGWQRAGDSR